MATEARKTMSNEIGDYLKQLRKERHLTLDKLSSLINLTPQAIGLFERYKRVPSVEVIKSYAKALHVDENELLSVRLQTVKNTVEMYGEDAPAYLKNEYSMLQNVSNNAFTSDELAEGLQILSKLKLTQAELEEVEAFINAKRALQK